MPKLEDLDPSEIKRSKIDKKGTVLCLWCEKNPAKVSEYGMLRKCDECEKERFSPMAMIDEPGGRKMY